MTDTTTTNPLPGGRPAGHHRVAIPVTATALAEYAGTLQRQGFRLALVAAHEDSDTLRAVYLYLAADPDRRVELHLPVEKTRPALPTLAGLSFPASRFEREMHDLYGIQPADHPLPRRLIRHGHWPSGWYPMRRDSSPPPTFTDDDGPFPFLTVQGPGVYEIPVGPVHAGLIEPGHFRFSVVGETILKLKARLWYVHKGIEKLFEDREPAAGLPLAERISGDTAVGHTLAYASAVGDLGALCNDVGHSILNTHALRIKESLLRLNKDTTGHRLLRGGILLGGASLRHVPDPAHLAAIGRDIREIVALALDNSLVAERLTNTAILTTNHARDLGTLGYVARASGLDIDARRDHPTGILTDDGRPLADLLTIPIHTAGDVLARFQQRAAEIDASLAALDTLVRAVTPGTIGTRPAVSIPSSGPVASGVGIVEGWRGTIVHRVEIGTGHRLARVKIVDPSFFNWPALPIALTGTIVPDFPLANKSFNLSYAGNDL